MNPLVQLKKATILPVLIALTLGCFALSPQARAVDPPPDGDYPNQNTAEGEDALFSLTAGASNTAMGYHALHDNTTGSGVHSHRLRGTGEGLDHSAAAPP